MRNYSKIIKKTYMKKNFKNKTIYKDLPCLCMGPKTIWDQTYQWTRHYLFLGPQSENLN